MTGTATELVKQFQRLRDPTSDPDHALHLRLDVFFREYLATKGGEGGNIKEAQKRLFETKLNEPGDWPENEPHLARVLREVIADGSLTKLPPLPPGAQLAWLGFEGGYPAVVIDTAISKQFPTMTPPEIVKAFRDASQRLKEELHASKVQLAIFQTWYDIEAARGRPEGDLIFGNCLHELDLIVPGTRRMDFNRLKNVADSEMRQATLAAAWTAAEQDAGTP